MEVVGIQNVDYVSRKSGKPVKGIRLHLCGERDDVQGVAVQDVFVSERVECDVKIGDQIELFYNQFGQINKVSIS